MKIYQIIPTHKTFPVIYQSADIVGSGVHDRVKDFVKLEDNIYATFNNADLDSAVIITKIPDHRMIEGKLEYFNHYDMDEANFFYRVKQKIIPFWKKIAFNRKLQNL